MREKDTVQQVGDFTADWLTNADREIAIDDGGSGTVAALKLSINAPGQKARTLVVRAVSGPLKISFE
jgi:hypothetical protein